MTDAPTWAASAAAALSATFAFFKWALPFFRDWQKSRADREVSKKYGWYQDLYSVLQEILGLGTDRVIVFKGHNGGGLPRPGTPFYVTAVHWLMGASGVSRPQLFRNLPPDLEYVKMLVDVKNEGSALYATEDMAPCQLRRIYEAEGVNSSLVVFLGLKDREMYYMSVALQDGKISDTVRTEIELRANLVRNLILSP